MKEEKNTCCFLGHRKIIETESLKTKLYETIETLIVNNNVEYFLFGSRSDFDKLCYDIVTRLKEKYTKISRIYVRAEYPYIDESYRAYLLKNYEETYFPECVLSSGKAVYVERNNKMIDEANFCVFYYCDRYAPPKRKYSRRDVVEYQPKSGTTLAYEYAKRKKKLIINVFE